MELDVSVFDVWTFRRGSTGIEYLLLHTSQAKADRWFNGGRFWQIPSHFMAATERVPDAVRRLLGGFGIEPAAIWAAELTYTIYNRRFDRLQLITVFAAEAATSEARLDPAEHAEYRWCSYDDASRLVTDVPRIEGRPRFGARVRHGARAGVAGAETRVKKMGTFLICPLRGKRGRASTRRTARGASPFASK
jgi:hypothetical protein